MLDRFYRSLYRIRRVEQEVARVYPTDKIKSPVHLSIGQEAVAVGVCEALQPEDIIFCSYRSHAAYLAKGGDLKGMVAELFGKATGVAKGKGGSMHLIDTKHGVMGASAVVGTTIAQAVGYAYAMKYKHKDVVVATFFGDGATDEGVFYESLNFAALKKLPVLFVCENNGYAIHTPQRQRQTESNLVERAQAQGVPGERVNDDVLKLHERVRDVVATMRAGALGPYFLECLTYRWMEHVGPNEDYQLGYRSRAEAEVWLQNDQVRRLAGMIAPETRVSIENDVEAEIQGAFSLAEASPFPEPSELYTDTFKEG